jgi:hypothetical protein
MLALRLTEGLGVTYNGLGKLGTLAHAEHSISHVFDDLLLAFASLTWLRPEATADQESTFAWPRIPAG